ncbi:MFS transporter [Tsukamurella sp. USMM236]|uniref:MFS transporter n=1 Tax=Tsukamurella sp. USMM236 TaxID=3081301 RepID=UPI003019DD08
MIPAAVTRRVLLCCWIAILAEGYDVGVFGAVVPGLLAYEPWSLSAVEIGGLAAWSLVGMLIGATTIGVLADRVGRKNMLLVAVALCALPQLGVALAPSPEVLGLFRFVGGLGLGGVIPIAAAYTIEFSPPAKKSRNYGIMYSGYSLGIMLAALVAVLSLDALGWRWVMGLGFGAVILVPILAVALPQSIEQLAASGQTDRAAAEARRLGIEPPPAVPAAARAERGEREGFLDALRVVFSPRYRVATACFWLALFCGLLLVYGLNTWLPQIMRKAGYDLGSSLMFLLVFSLASAIGGIVVGLLADRRGQKPVLVVCYAVGALGILALMFRGPMVVNYLLVGIAGIGSISTSLVLTGWVAHYYPARIRAAATGMALSFARVGAIVGPIVGGFIAGAGFGYRANFVFFAVVGGIAALAVAALPLLRGESDGAPEPEESVTART